MAGYSKIYYCIAGFGEQVAGDFINPIVFQILMGDGERRWLEAHYFDDKIKPLGNVKWIYPQHAESLCALLDACIVFYPDHFRHCSLLKKVEEKIKGLDTLDFVLHKDNIPPEWEELRQQALPAFKGLNIHASELIRLDLDTCTL